MIKRTYSDEPVIKFIDFNKTRIYYIFLYSNIKIGSKPDYKIICKNKERLTSISNMLSDDLNLHIGVLNYYFNSNEDSSIYEEPIILNLNTGEVIKEI